MLYRAFQDAQRVGERLLPHVGPRPPGNIPYVADNIIEWTRPNRFPSRRRSVFANATRAAACGNVGGAVAYVYEVVLPDGHGVTHLRGCVDARYHPSIQKIQKLVQGFIRNLPVWLDSPWEQRGALAALFLPCLCGEEAGSVIHDELPALEHRLQLEAAAFWNACEALIQEDVTDQHDGELTFLVPEHGYTLANQVVCPGRC